MDDQPKEGGEGDKKIVHVYPLVKVSFVIQRLINLRGPFCVQFSNQLVDSPIG
jgi:hypothetical protein